MRILKIGIDNHKTVTCAIPGGDGCRGAKNLDYGKICWLKVEVPWLRVFLAKGGVVTEKGNLWENHLSSPHTMINDLGFDHEPVSVMEAAQQMKELIQVTVRIPPINVSAFRGEIEESKIKEWLLPGYGVDCQWEENPAER